MERRQKKDLFVTSSVLTDVGGDMNATEIFSSHSHAACAPRQPCIGFNEKIHQLAKSLEMQTVDLEATIPL